MSEKVSFVDTTSGEIIDLEELIERAKRDQVVQYVKGREVPDPTPMAPPVGWFKQPTMVEHIRSLVAHELSRRADAVGHESFEEADDFDLPDGDDPHSPYENEFEPPIAALAEQARKAEEAEKPVEGEKEPDEGGGPPKQPADPPGEPEKGVKPGKSKK